MFRMLAVVNIVSPSILPTPTATSDALGTERPLVSVSKGMTWSRANDEVRALIERTQIPFLRSPMGKGVMPDDHPLSVAVARTLPSQQVGWVERRETHHRSAHRVISSPGSPAQSSG
jgi:hypothetical protein